MTFLEASAKLDQIAEGRYHVVEYALTTNAFKVDEEQCSVYVDGGVHYRASTWEKAFELLANNGKAVTEQMPGGVIGDA